MSEKGKSKEDTSDDNLIKIKEIFEKTPFKYGNNLNFGEKSEILANVLYLNNSRQGVISTDVDEETRTNVIKDVIIKSFKDYVEKNGLDEIFLTDYFAFISDNKKQIIISKIDTLVDKIGVNRILYNKKAYEERIKTPQTAEEIEATPSSSISPEMVTEVAKFVGSLEERINQLGLDIKKINADVKKRQLLSPKELQERIDTFDDETLAKLERELNDLRLYNFKDPITGELEAGISEDTYKLYMDIIGRKRYSRKRDKTVYPPLIQRPVKPNVPMNYNR